MMQPNLERANQIVKLFCEDGLTGNQIGKQFGLSRERIRQILKRQGINPRECKLLLEYPPRLCPQCNEIISLQKRMLKRKFCSKQCRFVSTHETYHCQECGKAFQLYKKTYCSYPTKKYCSNPCKWQAWAKQRHWTKSFKYQRGHSISHNPFLTLQIGGSIFIEFNPAETQFPVFVKRIYQNGRYWSRKLNMTIHTKLFQRGIRVWRIA